jgi:hypothetical protein
MVETLTRKLFSVKHPAKIAWLWVHLSKATICFVQCSLLSTMVLFVALALSSMIRAAAIRSLVSAAAAIGHQ